MHRLSLFVLILLPVLCFSQYEFNNMGSGIYIQKGALIHVQGNFINDNNATNGDVRNDGIIEVKGNFENKTNSTFRTNTDNTSTDRVVKFVGSGTQLIKGSLGTPGTASFYNLVIDKTASTDVVEMQTAVNVDGSIVFGAPSVTTSTYSPSAFFTNNNQKGLIKTYTTTNEYVLSVANGNIDAIAGYPALVINGAPSTGYILTKGTRGSAAGGLQRRITSDSSYVFPIGTVANGFNGVRLNFTNIPAGGDDAIGKFNDGTDLTSGYVGQISQQCIGCSGNYSTPDNSGYNRYFASNPFNGNQPQWFILEDAITSHGYWSFASATNNPNYQYSIETFPNSYVDEGASTDPMRTLKYAGSYGYNPSADVWNPNIESVSAITDLLQYSKNTGNGYTGAGVPGGVYTGLAHFALGSSKSANALPVELLYIKANAVQTFIEVTWATSLEVNNKGFYVERSTDGQNWAQIAWVNGNNNATEQNNYTYPDLTVLLNERYYYRLKQVDNDGQFEYTDVVTAVIHGEVKMTVKDFIPNPAKDKTTLIITSTNEQKLSVDIYDVLGQKVLSDTRQLSRGASSIEFDTRNLASGTYTAIVTGNEVYAKKLVVAK